LDGGFLGLGESQFVEVYEGFQRPLVHMVYFVEVLYQEKQNTGSFANWAVLFSRLVYLFSCHLRVL
jgi:hypothetical protein